MVTTRHRQNGPPLLIPGIAFAVLTIAAAILGAGGPRPTSTASDTLAYDLTHHTILIVLGTIVFGTSIPLAFSNLFNLQFACETQVLAMAGNATLNLPPPGVAEHTAKLAVASEAPFGTEWPGLLRKLDRMDPSFRT